jgi:protein-S-isoprenylcysteine O-methyltransferase Ste14
LELGLFAAIRIALFILLSILLVALSWRPLHNPRSHGFYRFFAFEGILILVLMNISFWLKDPFSPLQLISWTFLVFSILFIFQGFYLLRKLGGSTNREIDSANLTFENTAKLVTDGIYKYIRHPMYSSLLLLAWGTLLKHITIYAILTASMTTGFLMVTAKIEERENISFFGSSYEQYMKRTKMFIPYLV